MQHLARKFEAEITFDFGSVIGTMENSRPTPLSLMREVVADGHSFADFQSRVLQPAVTLAMPFPYRAALQV
jgi:hypothetical protein